MKVLHVTPAFYPATYWGGPIVSVFAACNALARQDAVELRVLTTDAAGPRRSDRVAWQDTPVYYEAGYEVYFTRRAIGRDWAPGLLMRLPQMVKWADVVHLTGTYSFPTLPTLAACRSLGRPIVWSPRGALQATEQWSGVRRPRAKAAFEALCRMAMPAQAVLHVTAEMEREASVKRLPGISIAVIPNGVDIPGELPDRVWRPGGRLRLLYISRLDPKKGLENLLGAMSMLPAHFTLDIYGTGDEVYERSLKVRVAEMGLGPRVTFHGHVLNAAKTKAFVEADLFVLPSFSENFGMVVAEALAHGVPVVTSHATPWKEVETVGCGLWVDNRPDSIAEAILELSVGDLEAMGRRGRLWMMGQFSWKGVARQVRELYESLVAPPAHAT